NPLRIVLTVLYVLFKDDTLPPLFVGITSKVSEVVLKDTSHQTHDHPAVGGCSDAVVSSVRMPLSTRHKLLSKKLIGRMNTAHRPAHNTTSKIMSVCNTINFDNTGSRTVILDKLPAEIFVSEIV